jgi:hypothetical protein
MEIISPDEKTPQSFQLNCAGWKRRGKIISTILKIVQTAGGLKLQVNFPRSLMFSALIRYGNGLLGYEYTSGFV